MDPYVLLTCRTQEQKSSVASGKGSDPEWNENFVFNVSEGVSELKLKIMDGDCGSQDDFVGEVTISLEPVFMEGNLPPTTYNAVKDEEYRGEIRLGLTFTRVELVDYSQLTEISIASQQKRVDRSFQVEEESFGGWKDTSYRD
ncbi:hypothetical protein CRYUN_Cryun19dG0127300 [Craigia yunnanensis]